MTGVLLVGGGIWLPQAPSFEANSSAFDLSTFGCSKVATSPLSHRDGNMASLITAAMV